MPPSPTPTTAARLALLAAWVGALERICREGAADDFAGDVELCVVLDWHGPASLLRVAC